jgi:hypothetical protein
MLNVGPSGPPFAPYEGQKAWKLGRSRNEGIPEGTTNASNFVNSLRATAERAKNSKAPK